MTTFKQLGLSPEIIKAISAMGFETPSDIQEQAIPQLLNNDRDFIGLAQTGTGKTAAFGLPLLELVDPALPYTQGLILAPTRELGKQIASELDKFSTHLRKVNTLVVYGGAPIVNQMKALRKQTQHVIIATPGRLIDLIKRKAVHLDQLNYLVLDEADEMLNMGFKEEIDKILSYTPKEKLTWLFSATMPNEIKSIVNTYMHKPFEVKINAKEKVNTNIEHQYVMVSGKNKNAALMRFLDATPDLKGVVFCRTRRETQQLAEELLVKNYKADALHGDLSQAQRDRVMKRFRNNELQVLIATDVAARGIDVDDLTHVFHHSLPDDRSYYTHRSGRTARAGKTGTSITFINGREKYKINQLEKRLNILIHPVEIPSADEVVNSFVQNWCQDILNTRAKIKENAALVEKAIQILGNLSKEELVAKLLAKELKPLQKTTGGDLNEKGRSGGGGSKSRKDKKYGGRSKKEKKKYGKKKRRGARFKGKSHKKNKS